MPEGFTGETAPLPGAAGYGQADASDTQEGQTPEEVISKADFARMQSIKDRELDTLRKQIAERDGEMTRLQQEQAVQDRELQLYTALRRQGYAHADAQEEAGHTARYEVENHFLAVSREKQLEEYKTRDERVQLLAAQITVKKELREEFGLEPDELDTALKDLTGREHNYEAQAWKLARAYERKKAQGSTFTHNRALRDGMPVPGAGMGAKTPDEILNPPPGARPGSPEFEAYVTQKRAYLEQNRQRLSQR